MPEKERGKELAKRWGLNVQQALYRKTGDWYHQLKQFPGALLDADGYVIFESEEALKACPQLRIGKDPKRHGGWVSASQGIKAIPGYVYASAHEGETDRPTSVAPNHPEPDLPEELEGLEGAPLLRLTIHRRREKKLRQAKIADIIKRGRLRCQVPGCWFDFEKTYGTLGRGYAQVHHIRPLSDREEDTRVTLADLAVVCANCHAMIHRGGQNRRLDRLLTKAVSGMARRQ